MGVPGKDLDMNVRKSIAAFSVLLIVSFLTDAGPEFLHAKEKSSEMELRDLDDLTALKEVFNAGRGKPRLLVLLSPT